MTSLHPLSANGKTEQLMNRQHIGNAFWQKLNRQAHYQAQVRISPGNNR
jgi:hypothetical protein